MMHNLTLIATTAVVLLLFLLAYALRAKPNHFKTLAAACAAKGPELQSAFIQNIQKIAHTQAQLCAAQLEPDTTKQAALAQVIYPHIAQAIALAELRSEEITTLFQQSIKTTSAGLKPA